MNSTPRPQNPKFPGKCTIPKVKETHTTLHRIPQLSSQLLTATVRKITLIFKLLKADKQIKVSEELLDNYKTINAALAEA